MLFEKTKEDLLVFLNSQVIATVATIREGNTAHATTIYFHVDTECNFYFLTKDLTGKFDNLKTNQSAALVITDPASMQTVQVEGMAREVDYANEEYAPIMKEFTHKLAKNGIPWENMPINHLTVGYYVFIKVTLTWIKWINFKNWGHVIQYEQRFEPITS